MFFSVSFTNVILLTCVQVQDIQFSLGNKVAAVLSKGYQLCLTSILFVAV